MNIYDKLSECDREHIVDYIEAYAGFDSSSIASHASLDHILRFWNKNKEDLFKVFGGELILTKKISFNKPVTVLEDEISGLFCWGGEGKEFYNNFDEWARKPENHTYRYDLLSLMYTETLAKNTYVGVSFSVATPDGHSIAVNNGCKASKVLGKLANAFDISGYEQFRVAHSMCLNQKTLKGDLCVSIHPLDYMTMSDNNCDWSSCMSWMGSGDYRQGTVEMMNSAYVVVAYLRSTTDLNTCYDHQWNSKKWRQLFIVTPYIITGIRQYPYNSDELNGITLQWLRDLAQSNGCWGPYEDTAVKVKNHCSFPVASLDRTIHLDFHTHFMYNDFYAEHLSYITSDIPSDYELCFSGESECMACGEDISNYDEGDMEASSLTCNECEHVFWCSECGERCNASDLIYVDGAKVCSYCYEEHYHTCDCCEETHHDDAFICVYLREDDSQTANDLSYYIRVCENCINTESFINLFGRTVDIPYGRWQTRSVVDLCNITPDGLEYFDVWNEDDYERYRSVINGQNQEEDELRLDA